MGPHDHRPSLQRLGLRSEASARFERGADPEVVELAARRFAELLAPSGARSPRGRSTVGASCPTGPRCGCAPTGSTCCSAPSSPPTAIAAPARAHRLRLEAGGRRRPRRRRPLVPVRHRDRDRRDRGGGPPPRLQPHPAAALPTLAHTGRLTDRQQRPPARARRSWPAWASARPCRLPFLAPGDLERAGLPPTAVTITNPLAAEESVLRTSLRPGLLKAVAYNAAHRNAGVRLFEMGHVFGRAGAEERCPARRARAPGRGPRRREAPAAVRMLGRSSSAPRPARRRLEPDHGQRRAAPRRAWPGSVVGRVVVGEVGEVDPAVLEALRHRRAGGVARARPRRRAGAAARRARLPPRQPLSPPATSTWPSWSTRASPAAPWSAPCAGAAGELLVRPRPVRRLPGPGRRRRAAQPGLPAPAPGPGPHAHRRRGGRGPPGRGHRRRASSSTRRHPSAPERPVHRDHFRGRQPTR